MKKEKDGGKGIRRQPTRSKIVATIGPASKNPVTIRGMMRAGADVFRINFSHGRHDQHAQSIRDIRRIAREEKLAIGILADLQGPKIRLGKFRDGEGFLLKKGDSLEIVVGEELLGEPGKVSCVYQQLASDVSEGERILIDDGSIELRVEKIVGNSVFTVVRYGGILRQHKGVNLPGTRVQAPSLTEKDLFDLEFALAHNVDFIALSFVRSASDVIDLKQRIQKLGGDVEVISKIERPEAVKEIREIIKVSDGVMVARGDMGVELGPEKVPAVQKQIIELCNRAAIPVITATQMLESMISSPRPTRAEASDVANAIYDGTSALMLSAETASGDYPLLAVRTMNRIARETEKHLFDPQGQLALRRRTRRSEKGDRSISEATVVAAASATMEVGARGVVVFTETGRTAKLVARERMPQRMFAFTPHQRTYSRLSIQWGVIPLLIRKARTVAQLHRMAEEDLLEKHLARKDDTLVFIAGLMQVSGATNTVLIRKLGDEPEA